VKNDVNGFWGSGVGAASDRAGRVEGWDCFMGGDISGVIRLRFLERRFGTASGTSPGWRLPVNMDRRYAPTDVSDVSREESLAVPRIVRPRFVPSYRSTFRRGSVKERNRGPSCFVEHGLAVLLWNCAEKPRRLDIGWPSSFEYRPMNNRTRSRPSVE
jgi:hypothetical protein